MVVVRDCLPVKCVLNDLFHFVRILRWVCPGTSLTITGGRQCVSILASSRGCVIACTLPGFKSKSILVVIGHWLLLLEKFIICILLPFRDLQF